MYKVTSHCNGLIVCDLKDGETIRLKLNDSITIKDEQVTKYLQNVAKKKLISLVKVVTKNDSEVTKKTTTVKTVKEKKEE